ncbi:MAG TPA: MBL fold metallo-hydrolase, partial [Polyangiaceae bacterium]|nr:MBL fold metallo-hydrolase [Polyangiaceae bacterium]
MNGPRRPALLLATSLVASLAACHAPQNPPLAPARPPPSAVASAPAGPTVVTLRDEVTLRALAPGVWLHTSTFQHPRFGLTPANGLLVVADAEALLVDVGWSDAQAEALLEWAVDAGRRRLRGAVLTHAHEDRAGGLAAVLARGVPTYALAATAER